MTLILILKQEADKGTQLTYKLSSIEYPLAAASSFPRLTDLLTAGIDIPSLTARKDMVTPSSLTIQ